MQRGIAVDQAVQNARTVQALFQKKTADSQAPIYPALRPPARDTVAGTDRPSVSSRALLISSAREMYGLFQNASRTSSGPRAGEEQKRRRIHLRRINSGRNRNELISQESAARNSHTRRITSSLYLPMCEREWV